MVWSVNCLLKCLFCDNVDRGLITLGPPGIANTCPHLGAPLEQGAIDIEDLEDDLEDTTGNDVRAGAPIIMCPWHSMDFNLVNGSSSTGLRACTYKVESRGDELFMEFPGTSGDDYRLLGIRAVSESEPLLSIPCTPSLPLTLT